MYKPNIILNGSLPIKVECEYFWEVDEARDKTLPTEVVNNRYERDNKWEGITMTDKLLCPFCQQELKIAGEHTTIMSCFNGDCKGSGLYGEKEFWQELIRTRKELDVAVDALDRMVIDDNVSGMIARNAIKEIKALEQKD
jgi:hypothetical protein